MTTLPSYPEAPRLRYLRESDPDAYQCALWAAAEELANNHHHIDFFADYLDEGGGDWFFSVLEMAASGRDTDSFPFASRMHGMYVDWLLTKYYDHVVAVLREKYLPEEDEE